MGNRLAQSSSRAKVATRCGNARDDGRVSHDGLSSYRAKRDPARTPEPVPPPGSVTPGSDDTFVVQEHHASALHWDFRLERHGVLVSWAVPKGVPLDPSTNRLAVQTEDHPLSYADFEGDIGEGEYGGGRVIVWDRGTYETEEWTDRKVKVVLHGSRVEGRYVLFSTGGKNWMMHRMMPTSVRLPAATGKGGADGRNLGGRTAG